MRTLEGNKITWKPGTKWWQKILWYLNDILTGPGEGPYNGA